MIQSVLVQKAIHAALHSEWQTAIDLNEKILEQFPQDLDSLNRLARACFETGDISRCKQIYKEVLEIDPYNVIAQKNMRRFQLLKGNGDELSFSLAQSAKNLASAGFSKPMTNFIEEPGKTKVIQLVRIAEPQVLFTLHSGDVVVLTPKQRGVHIFTESNLYIGRIPDDLAYQLHYLMKSGNKYEGYIKTVQANVVYVFVRELYRTPEFISRPTFSYMVEIPAQETLSEPESTETSEEEINPDEQS